MRHKGHWASERVAMKFSAKLLLFVFAGACSSATAQHRDEGASSAISPEEVFETASKSVVTIVAVDARGRAIGLGSGVVVRPQLITTNCHVLKNADAAAVMYQEQRYATKVVDSMIDRDLCLLSVDGLPAPAVQTGSTNAIRVGQKVFALGAPHGLELTFSEGMVSSLRKTHDSPIIQTTAPISPGSSGGALLSKDGSLIGITTMQMIQGQNLNFAMPVDWVWDFRFLK
jgi:serine protease Do